MSDPEREEWRQALAGTEVSNSWDTQSTSARLRRVEQQHEQARQALASADEIIADQRGLIDDLRLKLSQSRRDNEQVAAERDRACTAMSDTAERALQLKGALTEQGAALGQALADKDAAALIADELRAEVTGLRQELAYARRSEDDLRAQVARRLEMHAATRGELLSVLAERDHSRRLLDECIARFGAETERLHGLLDQARRSNEPTPTKEN